MRIDSAGYIIMIGAFILVILLTTTVFRYAGKYSQLLLTYVPQETEMCGGIFSFGSEVKALNKRKLVLFGLLELAH